MHTHTPHPNTVQVRIIKIPILQKDFKTPHLQVGSSYRYVILALHPLLPHSFQLKHLLLLLIVVDDINCLVYATQSEKHFKGVISNLFFATAL